jgi:hypothetical protein
MLQLLLPVVAGTVGYLLFRKHEATQVVPPNLPELPHTVEGVANPKPPARPWIPTGPPLDKELSKLQRDAVWIALAKETNPGEIAAFAQMFEGDYPIAYRLLSAKAGVVVGVMNSPEYQHEQEIIAQGKEPPFGMPNSNAYAGQNMVVFANSNLTGPSAKIQPGIGPFKILTAPVMIKNEPVVKVMVQWVPGQALKQGFASLSSLTPWAWPYSGTTAYAVRDGIELYADTPATGNGAIPTLANDIVAKTRKGEQVHAVVRSGMNGPNGWARVARKDGKIYWTFLANPKTGLPVTNWSAKPV